MSLRRTSVPASLTGAAAHVLKEYERQRHYVAGLSRQYAREAKFFEPFQKALADHFEAGKELGMTAQELEAFMQARQVVIGAARTELENAEMLIRALRDAVHERISLRGYHHREPTFPTSGLTFTSARSPGHVVDVHAPNAGRDVVGDRGSGGASPSPAPRSPRGRSRSTPSRRSPGRTSSTPR